MMQQLLAEGNDACDDRDSHRQQRPETENEEEKAKAALRAVGAARREETSRGHISLPPQKPSGALPSEKRDQNEARIRNLDSRQGLLPPVQSDVEKSEPVTKGVKFATTPDDEYMPTTLMSTPKIRDSSAKFRDQDERRPLASCVAPQESSLQRPDYEDTLRRVSAVVHRHIEVCERRRAKALRNATEGAEHPGGQGGGGEQFTDSNAAKFAESNYSSPQFKMRFVRLPLGRPGAVYAMQQVEQTYARPTEAEIYSFISILFNEARLSSECSIVCLIYVERLMEKGRVPLTSETWRPMILCGLLLAHKVWQDHACWNIEFSQIYPQFSLANINKLEKYFLAAINWDLHIKQSVYAQYYFGLRSLTEQRSFRQRYNATVMGHQPAPHMDELQKRSNAAKKEALAVFSKSM